MKYCAKGSKVRDQKKRLIEGRGSHPFTMKLWKDGPPSFVGWLSFRKTLGAPPAYAEVASSPVSESGQPSSGFAGATVIS